MTLVQEIQDCVAEIRREMADSRRSAELHNALLRLIPLAEKGATILKLEELRAKAPPEQPKRFWSR